MPVETIQRLWEIMPPPQYPYAAGAPDAWVAVEEQLGFVLPQDYKNFISVYGTGCIADFLVVMSPFDPAPGSNLLHDSNSTLELFRTARARDRIECPYPVYPEPDGLFPWGKDDQAQTLFWQQVGLPNAWPIVITSAESGYFWRYEQTLTELLVSWLSWEQFYEPFPVWYLDPTQFPDEDKIDEEGHGPPPHLPRQPRTPEEAQALFQPYEPPRGLKS